MCFGQGRGVEIIPSIGNPQFGEGMEKKSPTKLGSY